MPDQAKAPTSAHFHIPIDPKLGFSLVLEDQNKDRVYGGVAIKPGVYIPGMGNAARLRIFIGAALLRTIAPTWKQKRVNLEHRQGMEDEVGLIQDSYWDPNNVGVRQDIRLQALRPKFLEAIGFVEGRLRAEQVPNLSVEFEDMVTRAADDRERSFFDVELIGAIGAGTALVTKGACNERDGCGIGLCLGLMEAQATAKPNPSGSNAGGAVTVVEDTKMPCGDQVCLSKHAKMEADLATALSAAKAADGLRTELAAAKTSHDELKAKLAEAEKQIQGFQEATKTAMLESLQKVAPKTADLRAVLQLGAKDELNLAPLERIEVALRAFQSFTPGQPGQPAQGPGRATKPTARDHGAVDRYLSARRESLGLMDGGKPKTYLPKQLQRNTDRIMDAAGVAKNGGA